MAIDVAIQFDSTPTGRAANSYSGLDRANTYFLQRPDSGNWPSDASNDDNKAKALIQATRAVNAYPGLIDDRFINDDNDQILLFPQRNVARRTGIVDSVGADTIVDSELANQSQEKDNFWQWGGIRIIRGTGADQVLEVIAFTSSTGTIQVVENWTTPPSTDSEYELMHRIPDQIFYACCEIAYLYMPDADSGDFDLGAERGLLQAQRVGSFSVGGHSEKFVMVEGFMIPPLARQYLDLFVVRCY